MKKLFLAGAVALFGMANAQLSEGNWMVGSSIANMEFTNGLNIQLNPKAGYFIQDRLMVGAGVGLGIYKANGVSTTQTNWTIAPFARYYFSDNQINSMTNNGTFFAEGSAGFGGRNSGGGTSTNGVELGLGAGYAYFITPNVSVEGMLKYGAIVGGGNTNAKGDLGLSVGFGIYLPTAKAKQVLKDQQ